MTIGSCTSCQSSSVSAQAARERQNVNRNDELAAEQSRTEAQQRTKESFRPDPAHILDIQA